MTDWFRSWHGAPTDPKWLLIARRANTSPGIVSAIVWALFDHASQAESRGLVDHFDVETYSAFSGFEEGVITTVITTLEDKGLIIDGRLAAWEKRQPKREDGSAERAKAHRDRERTQANATERPRVDTDTEKNTAPPTEELPRPKARRLKAVGSVCPPDYEPLPRHFQAARSEGFAESFVASQAREMIGWSASNANRDVALKADWHAAFDKWLSKAMREAKERRATGPPRRQQTNGFASLAINGFGHEPDHEKQHHDRADDDLSRGGWIDAEVVEPGPGGSGNVSLFRVSGARSSHG